MSDIRISRRDALRSIGGTLVAGGLATQFGPSAVADDDVTAAVIDTHVHLAKSRAAGSSGALGSPVPLGNADADAHTRLARSFEEETKKAGVGQALCMPRYEISDKDPLGIQGALDMIELVKGPKLHPIGIAHPERFDQGHLDRVDEVLKQGKVKALKAYLGYMHYEPYNPGYRPYYKLAAKHKVPVIFHCGDTYSRTAKVKFAHPLKIDEVAVDFPETKFVIAHFGNPWLLDAAQVVYKNKNVWIDLSAILIGDAKAFAAMEKDGVLERAVKRIKEGIEYAEAPDRFLFGSDWPLSPIGVYREFVRRLFPAEQHAAVFGGNAKRLFGL